MMKEVQNTRFRIRSGENPNRPYGGNVSEAPFTQALHHLAVSRGFKSQRSLAKALGVSQSRVSKWYTGSNIPSPEAFGELLILFNPNDEEREPLVELYAKKLGEQEVNHRLKTEGRTRFPITIHKQEQEIGEQEIGEDERSMWQYALNHDLLPKIIQAGMLTAEELDSISIYFKAHIAQNGLNIETFDRLSLAVAKLA